MVRRRPRDAQSSSTFTALMLIYFPFYFISEGHTAAKVTSLPSDKKIND